MVDDVGVGDRQDDVVLVNTGGGQHVFQVVDAGRAVGVVLVVHPVVGDHADDVAEVEVVAEQLVEAAEEAVGHRAAGRLGVLDEVGRRQVEQVERPDGAADGQTDLQRVVAHVPLIRSRVRPADECDHVGDPVGRQRTLVRLLGAGRRHVAVGEQAAQLVLGRHQQHLCPGVLKLGVDRRRPQERRVAQLHLFAGRGQVVVARQAVDDRRRAGDDRDVVGVGKRRHLAAPEVVGAASPPQQLGQPGQQAARQTVVQVTRIAAVDCDRHRRPLR